jgi:hypothetical protein
VTRTLALSALALVTLVPVLASAQGPAITAEVVIVIAREDGTVIDAELRDVPALRRAPFNAFRSMRIHSRPRVSLDENHEADIVLPNGRRLRLKLLLTTPDGRYRLRVSINRPNETDYLPLLQVEAAPGDPFFVAGQAYEGGTLIVGVRLVPAAR